MSENRLPSGKKPKHPNSHPKFDRQLKLKFLREYMKTLDRAQALKACDICLATFKRHLKEDEKFANDFEEIKENMLAEAESALFNRGVRGYKKDVFFQGVKTDEETVYSDKLLLKFLEANDPNKYGNKQTISHEGTIKHEHIAQAKDDMFKKLEKATGGKFKLEEVEDAEVIQTPSLPPMPSLQIEEDED